MKTIRQALRSALRCGAMGGLAVFAVTSHAQETQSRQIALDIEPQSMSDALNDWAQQTGLQLIFPDADITNRLAAPSVRGTYTAQAALNQLLAGTQLTYEFVNDRTVSIRERHPDAPMLAKPMGREQREPYVRLVDRRFGEEMNNAVTVQRVAAVEQAEAEGVEPQRRSEKRPQVDTLAEVVVTGSHIRGLDNNTTPVSVLDKAYIDSTGLSTTARLIESLPQNFALANQSGVIVPGVTGGRTQGSSINLRGIGEGTTLVLLNGRRMALGFDGSAVDISAIPLAAIDRVEILTDGASAIYGSDAVGGVVNFILRDDFDGVETRLRAGVADGGINEYRAGQILGGAWNAGNALVSVDYYKRDLLPATERDFVPSTSLIGSVLPRDESYSAMFAGQLEIAKTLDAFADVLYTSRDSYNESGQTTLNETFDIDNSQIEATSGLNWQVGRDWQIEGTGSYARNKLERIQNSDRNAANGAFELDTRFEINAIQVKADGSVFTLPGGMVRVALGGDWRSESYEFMQSFTDGSARAQGDFDQTVRSAFGEVHVPLVGPANRIAMIDRLELSLAGRLDRYSNFGSSFDPRAGLLWEPRDGLRFRGSYGTSFVAPKLTDYDLGNTQSIAVRSTDPGAPGGFSNQLVMLGTDVTGLSPQESTSSSIGVEFTPPSVDGLQLSLNYYRIDYDDRIANPPSAPVILGNPSSYASLTSRDPFVAEVNDYIAIGRLGSIGFRSFIPNFTPELIDVIVDLRRRNLSVLKTSGFDFSMAYNFDALGGNVNLGITGTYISELVQQVIETSAPFDTTDTIYNPPDWRARGVLGWQYQNWAANLFVNHTDSYTDNRTTTPTQVSSYTTVDLRVAYDFAERFGDGFWSGLTVSADVQNLFNSDPPRTAILRTDSDMGFDPTNANPLGRLASIEVMKKW